MAVEWTPHRFTGGALALDVANTVVLREWPDKRFDRFEDAVEIGRFAQAASTARATELDRRQLHVSNCAVAKPVVIAVREATDALFRDAASRGETKLALLAPFLDAVSHAIKRDALSPLEEETRAGQRGAVQAARRPDGAYLSKTPSGLPSTSPSKGEARQSPPLRFETALGLSALALLPPDKHRRIRICPICAWLFLDRSRNGSRTWCDMAVCGNRQKARRHYRSRKEREDHDG